MFVLVRSPGYEDCVFHNCIIAKLNKKTSVREVIMLMLGAGKGTLTLGLVLGKDAL